MAKLRRTFAVMALATGLVLGTSTAQALSSVSILWRGIGSTTAASASSILIADIVLSADTEGVAYLGISIAFDTAELQHVAGSLPAAMDGEHDSVALPGMGMSFSPLILGVTVDNTNGVIHGFDQGSLGAGLQVGETVTLGSFFFHVVSASGTAGDIDIVANTDAVTDEFISSGNQVVAGSFSGASVTPEPTTAVLLLAGLIGLGYAGRRSLR